MKNRSWFVKHYISLILRSMLLMIVIALICKVFRYGNMLFLFFLSVSILMGVISIDEYRLRDQIYEACVALSKSEEQGKDNFKFQRGFLKVKAAIAVLGLIGAVISLLTY